MYAILRGATYDTARLAQASETMTEFQDRHSSQPGYRGNVVVDAGDGRRLTLTIWETENHAAAARSVLEPEVRRLLDPLLTRPSQLVGTGRVTTMDLT
ncbi:MAG TPA: hypothetical protein VIX84_09240 [Acidimicrobiales bacterium]|jgi:hypothetical protein